MSITLSDWKISSLLMARMNPNNLKGHGTIPASFVLSWGRIIYSVENMRMYLAFHILLQL
jgi:hypothetical protein